MNLNYAACMLHLTHIDVARNLSSGALLTPESWVPKGRNLKSKANSVQCS